jgi:glycosyltransferase involved in cell wall biosynthesis
MAPVAARLASASRELLEWGSARRSLRWRRPPAIRTAARGGPPAIYYLCPDYPVPSGGIRAIYRHVDILNGAGLRAAVLHHSDGFSCQWFDHETRVLAAPAVSLSAADVLVVPEIYGPFLRRLPATPRLVAFNQNGYLTFEHTPAGARPPYELFEAALTVSDDSAELLRFAFPGLEVAVVPNSIDPDLFHPAAEMPPRRLAMMPRKRPDEAEIIVRLLGERLRGWELVEIEGAPEAEVAAALRSAPLFLALGRREGFGLPAAEAMASGCFVAGFPGFGGRDIFDPLCSAPVEDGDVLSASIALAAALERFESDPSSIRADGAAAAARTHALFPPARQSECLLEFYAALLAERQPA